ncbi:hypothetical protein NHX12_028413, partial [Muraenolepis orangiensis]
MYTRSNSVTVSVQTNHPHSFAYPTAMATRNTQPEIFTFERIPTQATAVRSHAPIRPKRRCVRVMYPAKVRMHLPPVEKSQAKRWLLVLWLVLLWQIYTEEPSADATPLTSADSPADDYQVLPFQSAQEEQVRQLTDVDGFSGPQLTAACDDLPVAPWFQIFSNTSGTGLETTESPSLPLAYDQSTGNGEGGDGAWCPEGELEPSDSQYLQVDLGQLTFVTVVGTQGRYARSSGKEFARAYRLNYSRDGTLWRTWKNRHGNPVVEANSDAYNPVIKDLHPPIITRLVRIIPVTVVSAAVCMRVELYGCPWEDGLVSYSSAEGQLMMPPGFPIASLNDSIYDGTNHRRRLSGGLGQLTDGVIGQDDFLLTRQYHGWPGYDYLGWRKDSLSTLGYVEMEFVFDRQRNFTSMKVHSNNMFSRGVKIFSNVSCWFKLGAWGAGPVVFHTVLDDRNPSARYVTVPLGRRAATALRCRFCFADVWMMFSEISFLSEDTILPTQPVPTAPPLSPDLRHGNHGAIATSPAT